MKKKIFFVSLLSLGLLFAQVVAAAEFVGPEEYEPGQRGQDVTVGANETHKNLYVAGANVVINGKTLGDLVAVGAMVNVEGSVEKDLTIVGGNLSLSGLIGDDAKIAGANVVINSPIVGDLLVGGGNVTLNEKAFVGGDLVIGGGNVIVNAPVKGNVKIAGGTVTLNSKVEGDVKAKITQQLIFGPRAEIAAKVFYQAPRQAVFRPGSQVPNVEFQQYRAEPLAKKVGTIFTIAFLVKILAWIIAGLILIKLRKQMMHKLFASFTEKLWENLGVGLAAVILVPIFAVLLFATLIGYYLALLVGVMYIFLLILVNLLSAIMFGYLILRFLTKPAETSVDWQAVVIGIVILSLLKFIPFVGWLIYLIVFLITFGAVTKMIKTSIRE